jgi:hypothetical protein
MDDEAETPRGVSSAIKKWSIIAFVAILLGVILTLFVINKQVDSGKSSNLS